MTRIRIVLIEDHELTRLGLEATLKQAGDIEVVESTGSGRVGLSRLEQLQPDLAIVDIGLPDLDGIEITQKFRNFQAQAQQNNALMTPTRILMLTMHDREQEVLAAFAAGADSYSMKDVATDKLLDAIRITHAGQAWIDPAIARIVLSQSQKTATPNPSNPQDEDELLLNTDPLTERELEILQLIVNGYSNAKIAEELYITVGTVKTHVRNVLNKLCVDDRTQAAVLALRSGLLQ